MRRPAAARVAAAALAAAGVLAGCGAREHVVADACMRGPEPLERALAAAPARVALPGGTPLSDCVSEAIDPSDLQSVGVSFTEAAARLSPGARRGGPDALRLGYLVGAVERGSKRTAGFQAELLFRMRSFVLDDRLQGRSRAEAERGRRAGRTRG